MDWTVRQLDNHSRDLALYLVLTVLSLLLLCQFYCTYKHLAKINNLEVRAGVRS